MQTRFMTSFPWFWLKGTVAVDDDSFTLLVPNTFGGAVKTGTHISTVDYKHMASAQFSFDVEVWSIIMALILEAITVIAVPMWWLIAGIGLIVAFLCITAIKTTVTIRTTSSEEIDIFFIVFECKKAKAVYEALIDKIKTNGRSVF